MDNNTLLTLQDKKDIGLYIKQLQLPIGIEVQSAWISLPRTTNNAFLELTITIKTYEGTHEYCEIIPLNVVMRRKPDPITALKYQIVNTILEVMLRLLDE